MRLKRKFNQSRRIFQLAILLLAVVAALMGAFTRLAPDVEAFCPFGGLLALGSKLWLGSLSCSMSEVQIMMGIVLLIAVLLVGKLFCSFLCPIGTITEWLHQAINWRLPFAITLRGITDRILRLGKYGLLFFSAYFTVTASELWCKKFDPYYAAAAGFNSDTVVWAGIVTLLTVLVVSVIIRFFWCKYACPLNALSNLIANSLISVPVIVLYFGLRLWLTDLSVLWLILGLCLATGLTEVFGFRFYGLRLFRIRLDRQRCATCSLCEQACPQGIPLKDYHEMTHPDCNLCLDCLQRCRTESALKLHPVRSLAVIPGLVLGFIFLGLLLGKTWQIATISERWGEASPASIAKMEIRDLRSVKCYGSARSLHTQLARRKGIVGIDAYARTHRVVVYYDRQRLDSAGVMAAIFKPAKYKIRKFSTPPTAMLAVMTVRIDGLFDAYDNNDLINLLRQSGHILGFETRFGEPVEARIVFMADSLTPDAITGLIEQPSYLKTTGNRTERVRVRFRCAAPGELTGQMTYDQFRRAFFTPYRRQFNHFERYPADEVRHLEMDFPQAEEQSLIRSIGYLVSHLSADDGVIAFETRFEDRPVARISYLPEMTDPVRITEKLQSPRLTVYRSDGTTTELDNPFRFDQPLRSIKNP